MLLTIWGLALWVASIWVGFLIGESKNREIAGLLLGILFGPAGVMLMFCVPAVKQPAAATNLRAAKQPAPAEASQRAALESTSEREWAARTAQWIGIGFATFLLLWALYLRFS